MRLMTDQGTTAFRRSGKPSVIALCALLAVHAWWRHSEEIIPAPARALPHPPSTSVAALVALGDELFLSRVLMLWLQAFDTQAGARVSLRDLDYARVEQWLRLCLALAPQAQYPLLAASRFYADIPDPVRARRMLDFVSATFDEDPDRRWPWLAHAVYVARHRLGDQPLALRYAHQLAGEPGADIPGWARQMEIFVLEDMGELEAAKVLLGGLLASGKVTDPHEAHFLHARLAALEARAQEAAGP